MSHCVQSSINLLHMRSYGYQAYCGPLSVTISSGGPNMQNYSAGLLTIAGLVVKYIISTR